MFLSLSGRFLFVHIAKTGGSSIRALLSRNRWKDPWYWPQFVCHRISHLCNHQLGVKIPRHAPISVAQELLPPSTFQQLFKFAFVRNPWDRMVSAFCHFQRERAGILNRHKITKFDDFASWIVHDSERYHGDGASFIRALRRPQWKHVVDLNERAIVDYVGRFEQLPDDFSQIRARLHLSKNVLPHKRKSSRQRDFRKFYTDHSTSLVGKYFCSDILNFGYQFDTESTQHVPISAA